MSSVLFDDGDMQRLTREEMLTEEAPRQLPAEDRSPMEEPMEEFQDEPEEDGFDMMLQGLLVALQRRLE